MLEELSYLSKRLYIIFHNFLNNCDYIIDYPAMEEYYFRTDAVFENDGRREHESGRRYTTNSQSLSSQFKLLDRRLPIDG